MLKRVKNPAPPHRDCAHQVPSVFYDDMCWVVVVVPPVNMDLNGAKYAKTSIVLNLNLKHK